MKCGAGAPSALSSESSYPGQRQPTHSPNPELLRGRCGAVAADAEKVPEHSTDMSRKAPSTASVKLLWDEMGLNQQHLPARRAWAA